MRITSGLTAFMGAALLCAALLLSLPQCVSADENPDIVVRIDSTITPTFITDPHPAFRERVQKTSATSTESLLNWGFFESTALICEASEPAAAFAVRRQDGVSVFLLSETEVARTYKVEMKLPKGLYMVESLSLPGTGDAQPRRSIALGETGMRSISGTMEPKSCLVVRLTNLFISTKSRLSNMTAVLYESQIPDNRKNRIADCLRDSLKRVERIEKRLGQCDRAELAKEIHQGMLLASQAEAMLRNAVLQGQLAEEKLKPELDAMMQSLSAISAACFDLFPMLSVEDPSPEYPVPIVILTLVNRGTQPVRLVNFTLNPPEGWTAIPIGYTLFDRLGPGESLSARFALGLPSDTQVGTSAVIPGDISYFHGHSAAHLKVQVTVKVPDAL